MNQQKLHCLVIRGQIGRYPALVQTLSKYPENIKIDLIDNDVVKVKKALLNKKLSMVFLFKESGLSLEGLAELMRKNASEAILISLNDEKPQSALVSKAGYKGVQVCNLHYSPAGSTSNLALKFLTQYAYLKSEFRSCKSLLRVSEQRCHWLVDSSSEAVAYIMDDMHLYANETYLNLFSHGSLHSLKLTAVSDLILEDERAVFFDFVRQYDERNIKASALIVTLHPLKGKDFRASIRLIPTVFCGTRCYQLWVRRLGSSNRLPLKKVKALGVDDSADMSINEKPSSPWDGDSSVSSNTSKVTDPIIVKENTANRAKNRVQKDLNQRRISKEVYKTKRPKHFNALLKHVLERREVSLNLSQLEYLNKKNNSGRQYMVDLNVSELEHKKISSKLPKKYHDIFWDQLMLVLLFQRLRQGKSKNMELLIPLTESSLKDSMLVNWLKTGLLRLANNATGCTFLLSLAEGFADKEKNIENLKQVLERLDCAIGVDNFEIDHHTKALLSFIKPKYVRFSKKWVMNNIKNKQQVMKLANAIKTLEKNNIKVITPYNSGQQMKKLFDMSGASFCQKQAVS